ncbi:uncharacterized protein LOC134530548 isoform X3 [Bacillus rossius redtenbacheri]|uniref:uncharacterized protein LOC134530548 isoform X3 n=1 Tax=Bacillus rossius redtenbacheri TaxID=93214 RepID=UPI002FDEF02A
MFGLHDVMANEAQRLSAMIKRYDELIAREERLLKQRTRNGAASPGTSVVSQQQAKSVESDKLLTRRLQRCERMNNLKFVDEHIQQLSSDLFRYEATGISGPIEFHVCFDVEQSEDDEGEVGLNRVIKSIEITLPEPFQKLEISVWLPGCVRNNDLQTILRCIPVYGELYTARQTVVEWLEREYRRFFTVDIRVEIGGMLITAHDEQRRTYFEVEWKIVKDPRHQSVCHSLFFSVYKSFAATLSLKCDEAFKYLAEDATAKLESLMNNWRIVADAVSGAHVTDSDTSLDT